MNILFLLIFPLVISGNMIAADNADDHLRAQQKAWQVSHPALDRGLGVITTDQHPHFFQLVLPKGQILWVLGTVHSMPLEVLLSQKMARDLVARSAFLINEGYGKCLSGEECDMNQLAEWGLMISSRIETLVEEHHNKFSSLGSKEKIREQYCVRDEDLSTWYGRKDLIELEAVAKQYIFKRVNITDLPQGFIHPLIFSHVISEVDWSYPTPPDEGVNHVLCDLNDPNKKLLSLETAQDVSKAEQQKSLREQVDKTDLFELDACRRITLPTFVLSQRTLYFLKHKKMISHNDIKSYNQYIHPVPPYNQEDHDPSMIRRNKMWVQRLQNSIFESTFDEAFMYVGAGHLPDLFKRLERLGCTVNRFTPAEYRDFRQSFTNRDSADFANLMLYWNPRKVFVPGA